MLDIASALSQPFKLVRIDLYVDEDQVLVGEITHCHAGAFERFYSYEDEKNASELIFNS